MIFGKNVCFIFDKNVKMSLFTSNAGNHLCDALLLFRQDAKLAQNVTVCCLMEIMLLLPALGEMKKLLSYTCRLTALMVGIPDLWWERVMMGLSGVYSGTHWAWFPSWKKIPFQYFSIKNTLRFSLKIRAKIPFAKMGFKLFGNLSSQKHIGAWSCDANSHFLPRTRLWNRIRTLFTIINTVSSLSNTKMLFYIKDVSSNAVSFTRLFVF